jgi:hypothetical protein
MSMLSAPAMTLIEVQFGIDEADHWGVNGSISDSGLAHQISLSNLVGKYALIKTTEEIIRAVDGSN